jgi:hypothetical protein
MPPRILIYGTEGVGKSSTSTGAPRPIFVPTEDGLGQIDCDKFPLATSFDEVMAALTALNTEQHDYETVVIDSLDWLERLIWDALCEQYRVNSIEKVDRGYGKGYAYSLALWRKFLTQISQLHTDRRMIVLLIAHAKIERFEDPEAPAYDRYTPRLHKHAGAMLTEWCDAVLFATRKFITRSEETSFGRQRAIAAPVGADGGDRILRTVGGPTCVAKNRYGLPAELPLSWNALVGSIVSPISHTTEPVSLGENHHG